jgi:2-dehydropantoate 2-reductase
MRVCIFGAGAIGGHIAVRLLHTKAAEVAVVARGATLEAIRRRGLTLRSGNETYSVAVPTATDDASMLPPQDLVIVAMKAPTLPAAASAIARLIAPQGCALFVLNGIPWWWHFGHPGTGGTLPLLDPAGALWNLVRPERVLGASILSANDIPEPGVIVHRGANAITLGEPDNSSSARVKAAADLLAGTGLGVRIAQDLRREIWLKHIPNTAGNVVSALTHLTQARLDMDPDLRSMRFGLMRELIEVAAAMGWELRAEFDFAEIAKRMAVRDVNARSSMLQDVYNRKPLEAEAMLGQTQLFAREAHVDVPLIDVVLPLLRGLDRALRAG